MGYSEISMIVLNPFIYLFITLLHRSYIVLKHLGRMNSSLSIFVHLKLWKN